MQNEICNTIVHAAHRNNNYKRLIRRHITELIKKTAPSNITYGGQLNIELR